MNDPFIKRFTSKQHNNKVIMKGDGWRWGNCRSFAQPASAIEHRHDWGPGFEGKWVKLILPGAGGTFFGCSCPWGYRVNSNHWSRIMTSWSQLGTPLYLWKIFLHFSKVENSFWAQKKDVLFKKEESHVWIYKSMILYFTKKKYGGGVFWCWLSGRNQCKRLHLPVH